MATTDETKGINLMNIWTSLPYAMVVNNNNSFPVETTKVNDQDIKEILDWLRLNQQSILEQIICIDYDEQGYL
jgi:hypothetical protein